MAPTRRRAITSTPRRGAAWASARGSPGCWPAVGVAMMDEPVVVAKAIVAVVLPSGATGHRNLKAKLGKVNASRHF